MPLNTSSLPFRHECREPDSQTSTQGLVQQSEQHPREAGGHEDPQTPPHAFITTGEVGLTEGGHVKVAECFNHTDSFNHCDTLFLKVSLSPRALSTHTSHVYSQ